MRPATILLVEDDDDYRGLLDDYLRSLGHRVVDFASAEEALGHIEQSGSAAASLVLTDLRMNGRSGLELAVAVKRARPELPIILMTAFGDRRLARDAGAAGVDTCIEKPFALTELARLVEALLARPPSPDGGLAG
jgi:DNA-binding NtrC family response regulator